MATHSSVLAWRIPGMGEPGELPSRRSHRVGHDWSDLAAAGSGKVVVNIYHSLENPHPTFHFHTGSCSGKFQGLCHTPFLPQLKKKVPLEGFPCVFWEQIWPSNSKQFASKPKTCFALISHPFLREIKEVLNYTAPLAKAWGTLHCQKRKPTLKATSGTFLFVWAFPEPSAFLVLKLQPGKILLL